MKILDISSITDGSEFPVKKGTLQFLQDADKESLAAIIQALIGPGYDPTVVYVLYGAVNTGIYPAYAITAGACFFNGEVYDIDATSFTASGANVAVFQIVTTQYTTNADPVTFSDSVVRNVHNIRKMQIVQGVGGSTIANYAQGFFMSFIIPKQLALTATGQASISGAYPNLNVDVPVTVNAHPIIGLGSFNIGDPTPGTGYTVSFATVGTAAYHVGGSFVSNGGSWANDSSLTYSIKNKTATSFQMFVREYIGSGMNVAFEWFLIAN